MIDPEIKNVFADKVKLKIVDDPIQWIKDNITLPFSVKSSKPNITPWMEPIILSFLNPSVQNTCFLGGTGVGKSTLLNCVLGFLIANDPGNTMVVYHTQPECDNWVNNQLEPMLQSSKCLKPLIPDGKGRNLKNCKMFPSMNLWMGSACESFAQSKSARYLLCDEAWLFGKNFKNAIGSLLKRNHFNWRTSNFWISQSDNITNEKSEWYDLYNLGSIFEWHLHCNGCDNYFLPKWGEVMKFEVIRKENDSVDWNKTEDTIKLVCPCCGKEHFDNPTDRSNLANNGKYIKVSEGLKTHESYHINRLCTPDLKYSVLVTEYLVAKFQNEQGYDKLLEDFYTKNLAEWYNAEDHITNISTYAEADFKTSELQEKLKSRNVEDILGLVMSSDVQQKWLWSSVIAFFKDGSIIPIELRKCLVFEEAEQMRMEYNIPPNHHIIDARFRQSQTFEACRKWGWVAVYGSNKKAFLHVLKSGRKEYKQYSVPQRSRSQRGETNIFIYLASPTLQNMVFDLKDLGQVVIPKESDPELIRQMNSTIRKTTYNEKGKAKTEIITRHKDNHMFDILSNSLFLGIILKYMQNQFLIMDENTEIPESENPQNVKQYQLEDRNFEPETP